jgi:hypothetical protein
MAGPWEKYQAPKPAGAATPGGGMIISDPAAIRELQLKENAAALDAAKFGVTAAAENRQTAASTWRNMTPEEVAAVGLNPTQRYQQNEAGKIEPITGATVQQASLNRVPQIQTALTGLSNIRALADKNFSVGRFAGSVSEAPVVGALFGQNRADLLGALSQIEGALIQDQLRELAKINPGGVASLANSEAEARRLASSIANLDPNQSQPEFLRGVQRAEEYFQRQLQQAGGEAPQADDGRIVKAPTVTAPGVVMGAMQGGEPILTAQDMADRAALQQAWDASNGNPEAVKQAAASVGRMITPELDQFMRDNAGQRVQLQVTPTGTPTATQEFVGGIVSNPLGEMGAAAAVEGANTFTLGTLDELAPVLGLDPQRVQLAKDYLRQRNPVSSLAGGIGAGIVGAGMGVPAALGRAGLNVAPLVTDAALGAAFGAGDKPAGSDLTDRLGGAALGAGLGAAGGFAARRMFGGGASGAGGAGDGGMTPPSGPMGGMGGATAASGARSSVSAAATPDDLIRASKAAELGIDLMPFQASRSFKDMQRAHELAKNGEIGGPLRERFGKQQVAIAQKFDDFIESTGSEIRENLRGQGAKLTKSLEKMAANDKAKVRTLYNQAAKSADAETPVPLSERVTIMQDGDDIDTTLIEWLNDQPTGVATSGITDSAKQFAARLGIAKIDPKTKELIPSTSTVKGMEKLRREISQVADGGDANLIRQKTVLKKLIDGHTEPYATGAYAKARAARREVAEKYEDVSTIAQLLGTKRNTPERVVAAESVMERLISGNTSVANLQALRKLTTGEGGDPQAWKEVQGATLEYLRGKAYGAGNNVDEFNNPVIQVAQFRNAVADMDKSGKLEELLGFEKAGSVRVMADVARDMFTAPAGSVNFSNTNSMWWNIADMLLNGALFQIPLPAGVASSVLAPLKRAVKEAPLKKEVKQLIGEQTQ